MKILLLSDTFNGYGAERMLVRTGCFLKTFGHEVHFCSVFTEGRSNCIDEKDSFLNLGINKSTNVIVRSILYFLIGGFALYQYCRREKIQYVISFKENPLCLLLLVRCFLSLKHIHSERDNPYNRDTIPSKTKMKLYRFVTKVVFQTEGARDFFGDVIKKKSVIIPNSVTIPNLQWSYSHARNTFVCVGRLDIRYKRQDILIKAFSKISAKYPDWEVILYGDGDDRCILEKMAMDLNVYDKIRFQGKVSDVTKRIVQDGVFVLTSDTEGIPNALMEAMALGMPVITTDCEPGGAKLLVTNEKNGLIVDRSNVEKLKVALEFSITHTSEMAKMGVEARKTMSKFSPSIIAEKWNSLIL